jgi:GNAT superfamily N-acetyltransferase
MYTPLKPITLKSGEVVEAGVVTGPDEHWRERVQRLLLHKGDPWNWQNTELLTHDVGVEAHFHVLHRDGMPFSNIMTVERNGVGIFGHVWTNPEDRGQGAASQLMTAQMEHFINRGGRALYLGTGYDSQAYHIYRRHGFESIEPLSGKMTFFTASQAAFEAEYFAPGQAEIQPLDWPHWPASPALFAADLPGVVRCAPLGLFGRSLTEGPLLPAIRERYADPQTATRALVLCKPENGAVVGLAAWCEDPLWPNTYLCDVFCHPNFQDRASELLAHLTTPTDSRLLAYSDEKNPGKAALLEAAGFKPVTTLPDWLAVDTAKTSYTDVTLYQKS